MANKRRKAEPAQTPAVLARLDWAEAALVSIAKHVGADLPPPVLTDAGPAEQPAPAPPTSMYRAAEAHVARFSGTARLRAEDLHRSWKATGSPLEFREFAKLNGLA